MYKRRLTVFKVELVKVHALHQVPQGLGFKRGESRITNPPEKGQKETGETVRVGEKTDTLEQRNRADNSKECC